MYRTKIILGVSALFILFSVIFLTTSILNRPLNPGSVIEAIKNNNEPVFAGLRNGLRDNVEQWGIEGALQITYYALNQGDIGMYQCHVLSHLAGHEAVALYGDDYAKILSFDSSFCELGYRHGAEAEIVHESTGNVIEELHRFCATLLATNSRAECYHGAGHAIMNDTLDVKTSLEFCNALEGGPTTDIVSCQNAVFAELTNLVGGSDGETGVPYTDGPPLSLGELTPLQYCTSWGEKYSTTCLFELSGLGVNEWTTPEQLREKLLACQDDNFTEELQATCIASVSAVGAQHKLAYSDTITFQPHVLDLSDTLRLSYIKATARELHQYIISGADRDWVKYCNNFVSESDIQLCRSQFITGVGH